MQIPQFVPLPPFLYQDPRWCETCGREETFIEVFAYEGGRLGYCFGCGVNKEIRDTRMTEAA